MTFKGWPIEAIEFFERLEDENNKSFWTEQKPVYDEAVKAPMEALLADLAPRFGEGKIFRPYRDVRFLERWLQDGPPRAEVTDVIADDVSWCALDGFTTG